MRCSTCMGLLISGQLSHASPTPSLSRSVCIGFGTLGQLSSTFWIPAKHPHSSHTQRWCCRDTKKDHFIKLNSHYRLHRCRHHKHLPLRYCQCLSGRCWERWDSYHMHHRTNQCQSSADLYWKPTDSYPEKKLYKYLYSINSYFELVFIFIFSDIILVI